MDVLGWDFELGIDKEVEELGDNYSVDINLKYISKEASELKDPSESDEIKFFDLNYLNVDYSVDGNKVTVEIDDFILANTEYVDEEVREEIEDSTDWIDYWAIDFDYKDDIFHNMWQSFRTRNDRELDTSTVHKYDEKGKKKIFVKVIDVFGNDTNSILEVEI